MQGAKQSEIGLRINLTLSMKTSFSKIGTIRENGAGPNIRSSTIKIHVDGSNASIME
jgi:hypothetical protein